MGDNYQEGRESSLAKGKEMTDEERVAYYKGMTEHDLLINIATRVDAIESICQSRARCSRSGARKYTAIGAGIGAAIMGAFDYLLRR